MRTDLLSDPGYRRPGLCVFMEPDQQTGPMLMRELSGNSLWSVNSCLLGVPLYAGPAMDGILEAKCRDLERALTRIHLLSSQDALLILRAAFGSCPLLYVMRASNCVDHPALNEFDLLLLKGLPCKPAFRLALTALVFVLCRCLPHPHFLLRVQQRAISRTLFLAMTLSWQLMKQFWDARKPGRILHMPILLQQIRQPDRKAGTWLWSRSAGLGWRYWPKTRSTGQDCWRCLLPMQGIGYAYICIRVEARRLHTHCHGPLVRCAPFHTCCSGNAGSNF